MSIIHTNSRVRRYRKVRKTLLAIGFATIAALIFFAIWEAEHPVPPEPNGSTGAWPSKWGMFGDFFGGTLNPILAFLTLFAVLDALVLQSEELGLTRQEYILMRKEHTLMRKEYERRNKLHKEELDLDAAEGARADRIVRLREEEGVREAEALNLKRKHKLLEIQRVNLRKKEHLHRLEISTRDALVRIPSLEFTVDNSTRRVVFANRSKDFSFVAPVPKLPFGMTWNPDSTHAQRELHVAPGAIGSFWLQACTPYGYWVACRIRVDGSSGVEIEAAPWNIVWGYPTHNFGGRLLGHSTFPAKIGSDLRLVAEAFHHGIFSHEEILNFVNFGELPIDWKKRLNPKSP